MVTKFIRSISLRYFIFTSTQKTSATHQLQKASDFAAGMILPVEEEEASSCETKKEEGKVETEMVDAKPRAFQIFGNSETNEVETPMGRRGRNCWEKATWPATHRNSSGKIIFQRQGGVRKEESTVSKDCC